MLQVDGRVLRSCFLSFLSFFLSFFFFPFLFLTPLSLPWGLANLERNRSSRDHLDPGSGPSGASLPPRAALLIPGGGLAPPIHSFLQKNLNDLIGQPKNTLQIKKQNNASTSEAP